MFSSHRGLTTNSIRVDSNQISFKKQRKVFILTDEQSETISGTITGPAKVKHQSKKIRRAMTGPAKVKHQSEKIRRAITGPAKLSIKVKQLVKPSLDQPVKH